MESHLTDNVVFLDELSYQITYQQSWFLSGELQRSMNSILTDFKTYLPLNLQLHLQQRMRDAWFIKTAVAKMRLLDLSSRDAFPLRYCTRSIPAFDADGSINVNYLHTSVLQLDSVWPQMLCISAFSVSVPFIMAETVIQGQRSSQRPSPPELKVSQPQPHMNKAVFGDRMDQFHSESFLKRPLLAQGDRFKPLGGKITYCLGRHTAKHAVWMLAATALSTDLARNSSNLPSLCLLKLPRTYW